MTRNDVKKTDLIWPDKYDKDGRHKEIEQVKLPFQVIETINESRATREARKRGKQFTLYDLWSKKEGETFEEGWKNKLIWGENKLVMSSLVEDFAGKIDLIYIDPPFATGADFNFANQIGENGPEVVKEQSLIEEKVYRDTWGKGIASYLQMMYDRLVLMRELLAENGSIYIHLDWHVGHYVKIMMDELFGPENLLREVIWSIETSSGFKSQANMWIRGHDTIFVYKKGVDYIFTKQYKPLEEKTIRRYDKIDEDGRKYKIYYDKGEKRIVYLDQSRGRPITDVWTDIIGFQTVNRGPEYLGFPTQKPEGLLERIIKASSNEGDIIADFFCGSGTTLAVAEKLNRRWIGCDLSRWAIHVTRKRLLGIQDCKPFELLNLGKYERKYWQAVTFGKTKKHDERLTIFEYLKFILKLYGAEPLSGMQHLHGRKGSAVIHVGAVDAPVTIDEINACLDECAAVQQREVHILGWEWEMGLYDLITEAAKGRGINLVLLAIPREVMEKRAVKKGDIQFYELAYLEADIMQQKNQKVVVEIKDFVIPNYELLPEEIREMVKKWSDYIDYWAVDWDFRNDTFMNGWATYRTRRDRKLLLKSAPHKYDKPGKYTIMVKVVDVFGSDTSKAFEVEVK